MAHTNIYKLGYLDPYTNTGDVLDMDRRRFTTIERQTYWLYSIFGNGVLDDDPDNPSWRIQLDPSDQTGQQVIITSGRGHVEWKSAITLSDVTLRLITSTYPATFWIYATPNDTTPDLQTVTFIATNVEITDPLQLDRYIGLGGVEATIVNDQIVLTPYNTAEYGRRNISLFSTLASIINKHRHIGGANNPSPIDLAHHVQGKLDGDYIENLDLSKVTRGFLNPDRIPAIDHNILTRRGTLTHSQIDALLGALTFATDNRLSDLIGINMLQLALALKRQAGGQNIDQYLINALIYVPGVTEDRYASYYSNYSTFGLTGITGPYVPDSIPLATIDKINREIRGISSSPMAADQLSWTTRDDWDRAITQADARVISISPLTENVVASGQNTDGLIKLSQSTHYRGVASIDFTTWDTGYRFTDKLTKLPVEPPPNYILDNYDATRFVFLEFGSEQDWTLCQKILIGFGLDPASLPGDINAFLILAGSGSNESMFLTSDNTSKTISRSKYVTIHDANTPSALHQTVVKNLAEFVDTSDQLARVIGIGFTWSTTTGWESPQVDFRLQIPDDSQIPNSQVIQERQTLPDSTSAVFIWNETYYDTTGRLVLRFDSNYDLTTYSSILFTANLDSLVHVYTRVANTENDLATSSLFAIGVSGSIYAGNNIGRWIDIVIEFQASANLISTPELLDLTLNFMSPSSTINRVWNSKVPTVPEASNAWSKNTVFQNLICDPDSNTPPNAIRLQTSNNVGRWTYLRDNNLYGDFDTNINPESIIQDGASLYSTPMQVWNGNVRTGYETPQDYSLTKSLHYVFADTRNDRLIEIDADGQFVKSVQGNLRLRKVARAWAALTAHYNPRLGKLWISLSQNTSVLDKSKMFLVSGADSINFGNQNVQVYLFGADTSGKSATLEVLFSSEYRDRINTWSNSIKLILEDGALKNEGVSDGLEGDPSASGGSTTGGGTTGGGSLGGLTDCELPEWLKPDMYEIITGFGVNLQTGASFCRVQDGGTDVMLPPPSVVSDDGVFDPLITQLQGSEGQIGRVQISVFSGEVVFDNLFEPLSIQSETESGWVTGTSGANVAIAYTSTGQRNWTISSDIVALSKSKGSVYELSNRNVLIAAPAPTPEDFGRVLVINRISDNAIILNLPVQGDANRAIPDATGANYYVAIYDAINVGKSSRLIKINTSGKINWIWGTGSIINPIGLNLLPNNHILVSE